MRYTTKISEIIPAHVEFNQNGVDTERVFAKMYVQLHVHVHVHVGVTMFFVQYSSSPPLIRSSEQDSGEGKVFDSSQFSN